MLRISAVQMDGLTRGTFYDRLHRFVIDNALRADWQHWMGDHPRLRQLWDPVWSLARGHSEHDCALLLILLAIRAFEGQPVADPAGLLAQLATREVHYKGYLAGHGYLHFTAFDYARGALDEVAADV